MIRYHTNPDQLRVDTTIKIIESDGTETTAPVIVLIGLNKVNHTQQNNVYKITNRLFNREFLLDRRIKATSPKKRWWKIW